MLNPAIIMEIIAIASAIVALAFARSAAVACREAASATRSAALQARRASSICAESEASLRSSTCLSFTDRSISLISLIAFPQQQARHFHTSAKNKVTDHAADVMLLTENELRKAAAVIALSSRKQDPRRLRRPSSPK
jgi:hypothetical protein